MDNLKSGRANNKKIAFGLFLALVLCLFIPQAIVGQTETFDVFRYTPPRDWIKTTKEGAVIFVDVNKTTNTFCVLTIHSGTVSAGNAEKDFAAGGQTFVANHT